MRRRRRGRTSPEPRTPRSGCSGGGGREYAGCGPAAALGIETPTRTNLSLKLSDERIEDLATWGLGALIASADGYTQEAYEKYRVGGRVELLKQNLERLKAAVDGPGSSTSLIYQYLVFEWNEHDIEDAKRFCEELGLFFQVRDAIMVKGDWLPSCRMDEKPYLSAGQASELAQEYAAAGSDYWKES